jgi:hypothetical protein
MSNKGNWSPPGPIPRWMRRAWPAVEKAWREFFAKVYRDLAEGGSRAEVTAAWERFRAEALPSVLKEYPPTGREIPIEPWLRATFPWLVEAVVEKVLSDGLTSGEFVTTFVPGPGGKVQQLWAARHALGKPSGQPEGN